MNNKIALKQFFESKELLYIHCKTKDQAKKLCKAFNELGKKWDSGKSYSYTYNWNTYKQNTCYSNKGTYTNILFFKYNDFKIYEFEDIIFEEDSYEKTNNKMMNYYKDKIAFNNYLKTIIKMQKDLKQPIYVIARFWLNEFKGIEDIITCDGDKDLEEIKHIFKERYTSDSHSFGVTETSYRIFKINISEVEE